MAKNPNPNWRPPAILHFFQNCHFESPCDGHYLSAHQTWGNYLHSWSRYGKNQNQRWRPLPSWILAKVGFRVILTLVWSMSLRLLTLKQISSSMTQIWQKSKSKMAAPPSWILVKVEFWVTLTLIWWMSICVKNFKPIFALATEMWPKISHFWKRQDGGGYGFEFGFLTTAILNLDFWPYLGRKWR